MSQLIQITNTVVALTNAVLELLVPKASEFTHKLNDADEPLRLEDVREYRFDTNKMQGYLTFKKGATYWFEFGHVSGFCGPHSFFDLQEPGRIPEFYGPVIITRSKAIALARGAIRRVGFREEEVYSDLEPKVAEPQPDGTNIIPHFLIEWPVPQAPITSVEVEINGSSGHVERFRVSTMHLRLRPPGRPLSEEITPRGINPVTGPEVTMMTLKVLPAMDDFAHRLGIEVGVRITSNQVARSFFFRHPRPWGIIILTNGITFKIREGHVTGFHTADQFFTTTQPVRVADFKGVWHLSDEQTISLSKDALRKAGCPERILRGESFLFKPYGSARNIVPRCRTEWVSGEDSVTAEVDAGSGRLKALDLSISPQ